MTKPASFLQTARAALKLHRKGKTAVEIKLALKLAYAADAHRAVNVAFEEESFNEPRLTPDEIGLLLSVAAAQRAAVARGDACSPKLKYCGHWRWPKSRAAYLAYKRLGSHRRGEDEHKPGTGLELLHPYNGYVRLTRAGWALVHALEAQGGAA